MYKIDPSPCAGELFSFTGVYKKYNSGILVGDQKDEEEAESEEDEKQRRRENQARRNVYQLSDNSHRSIFPLD